MTKEKKPAIKQRGTGLSPAERRRDARACGPRERGRDRDRDRSCLPTTLGFYEIPY